MGPPGATDVRTIQTHAGNLWAVGWTYFPTNYRAPNFAFNTTDKAPAGGGGTPQWYASPTLTATAYEGDANAYYASAGSHKTSHTEGGKDVYWDFSAAMSTRDRDAEQEHCDDTMYAYNLSLKEAEGVLTTHVTGKDFGPKPTKAEAEQMVLDAIKSHLTHPDLGNDKTQWGTKYDVLFRKTLTRDSSAWHSFSLGNRHTDAKGNVIYDIQTGSTKIGVVPSKNIIKY